MNPGPVTRRQTLAWGGRALSLVILPMAHDLHAAPTLPPELASTLADARPLGTGVLRFFGLQVYEARLWACPDFVAERYAQQPFALELLYARKLEGAAIAERSVAEMRRIGSFTEAQARQWLALMLQAFPDVAAQDRLLGLHEGGGRVRFFHNGRQTAQTEDADYVRLFFGIWLAPQTSAPALRRALLGLAP